jgi:hypothetical protein
VATTRQQPREQHAALLGVFDKEYVHYQIESCGGHLIGRTPAEGAGTAATPTPRQPGRGSGVGAGSRFFRYPRIRKLSGARKNPEDSSKRVLRKRFEIHNAFSMNRKTGPTVGKSRVRPTASFPSHGHADHERVEYQASPPAGSLVRTKKLLLAALRVWELKNGIRSDGNLSGHGWRG